MLKKLCPTAEFFNYKNMKSIIVDERINSKCRHSLLRLGFNCLLMPAFSELPEAVRSHPDSLIFKHKNRLFCYASYTEAGMSVFSDIREYHSNTVISFLSDEAGKNYPEDTRLNALVMGDRLFARLDSLAEGIKEYARSAGITLINTRQGYPACTTLTFGEKYAITADRGMKTALECEGMNVLLISEGGISLFPYEYGFIGGASFVHENTVYFFGDIHSHRDGDAICDFINSRGFSVVSLSEGGLVDLGGAVILE